jgi:hypothetical protein
LCKAGYGPLQRWILTRGDPLLVLTVRGNIYKHLLPPYNETDIIRIGDVLLGPDKIDHFFDQGYDYWRVSGDGADDEAAREWGVRSELGYFGMGASGVFSFADLKANWDGYQFYVELLDPEHGLFTIGDDGLSRVRDMRWSDVIDWQYDEFLNSNCYSDKRSDKIRRVLQEDPQSSCRTYCAMADQGAYGVAAGRKSHYLTDTAPSDCDNLFDLSWMCQCP